MFSFRDQEEEDEFDDSESDTEEVLSKTGRGNAMSREMHAADRLSVRLLAVENDDDEEDRVLRQSLRLIAAYDSDDDDENDVVLEVEDDEGELKTDGLSVRNRNRMFSMVFCAAIGFAMAATAIFFVGHAAVAPPKQPVGPYSLIERQEGDEFFDYYSFYEGPDSVGSNGYLQYVARQHATDRGILNVSYEHDDLDYLYTLTPKKDSLHRRRKAEEEGNATKISEITETMKPFIYMGSAPTDGGPRDSIRLEGTRRFNRGLFIIDVRHMPAGCGVWPAFWLTDEANWPVHGEIDIVEGVNGQSVAKTALHSTNGCSMASIPLGTMTGSWDTAQGIPNAKTGIPDMTHRYAQDCFVYSPRQWLNQGCVAVDTGGDSLGEPLNRKGGGVYALEWDPINRHIRSWVFSPHKTVPDNLINAIRTAGLDGDERVMPNPELWPLPYGYFAIGEETDCPSSHFRQMRLVFNTAFCGSVAGNRFQLDCPAQAQIFATCNDWIQSGPSELSEAYWKIRGVFVYEREWQ